MKWLACVPVPLRKSGCWPGEKTKSSEILSRNDWASAGADASTSPKTLHIVPRMTPPRPRRDAPRSEASSKARYCVDHLQQVALLPQLFFCDSRAKPLGDNALALGQSARCRILL